MGVIYLIRHGETTWNCTARYCGFTDLQLSERGLEQAERLAARMAVEPLAAVYASDLRRAQQTAEAIARPHGLPVSLVGGLRELNYGEWEGLTQDEVKARDAEFFARWQADAAKLGPPGGETFQQLLARAASAMEELIARHRGDTIAVVAHKSTNRALLCHWLDTPLERYRRLHQETAAVNRIDTAPDRTVVVGINDTCHLRNGEDAPEG
jgi:broad specificity phosphatase PhoE